MTPLFNYQTTSTKPTSKGLKHDPKGGFALVIALSLMAFILLLLLSITTLVRVETSVSQTTKYTSEAKQNALLGVNLALGQLIKYTGPDQRSTARADIEANNTGNPYWVGVWQDAASTTTDFDSVATPQLLNWLVSGNESTAPPTGVSDATPIFEPDAPLGGIDRNQAPFPTGSDFTRLVWEGVSSNDPSSGGGVVVPKVNITGTANQPIGSYAYWVGDHSTRASISPDNLDPSDPDQPESYLVPKRFGYEAMYSDPDGQTSGSSDRLSAFIDPNNGDFNDDLKKTSSYQDLSHIFGSNAQIPKNRYHDLTLRSYGVLSDPLRGGLKYDLTSALYETGEYWDAFVEAVADTTPDGTPIGTGRQIFGPVATADTSSSSKDPGGPEWDQLYSFANIRDRMEGETLLATPGSNTQVSISPILVNLSMLYVPSVQGDTGSATPTDIGVRFHMMPVVILWNPYDRPLKADAYYLTWRSDSVFNLGIQYQKRSDNQWLPNIEFSVNGRYESGGIEPEDMPNGTEFKNKWLHVGLKLQGDGGGSVTIPPGKALIFSPRDYTSPLSYFDKGNITRPDYSVMEPGFRPGNNFHVDGKNQIPASDAFDTDGNFDIQKLRLLHGSQLLDTEFYLGLSQDASNYWTQRVDDMLAYYGEIKLNGSYADQKTYDDGFFDIYLSGPNPEPLSNISFVDVDSLNKVAAFGLRYGFKMPSYDGTNTIDGKYSSNYRPVKALGNFNPRAMHMSEHVIDDNLASIEGYDSPAVYGAQGVKNSDVRLMYETGSADKFAPIGHHSLNGNIKDSILFRTISEPKDFYSLGDLGHGLFFRFHYDASSSGDFTLNNVGARNSDLFQPAYSIGNAYAPPQISSANYAANKPWHVFGQNDNWSGGNQGLATLYDMPYMLNKAVWDRFYFSAIDPARPIADRPRHPRLTYLDSPLSPDAQAELLEYETAAEHLLIDGAFNVNSTSVQAWTALLASFFGESPETGTGASAEESLFSRMDRPTLNTFDNSGSPFSQANADPNAFAGARVLTPAQIDSLARALVKEIQRSGPFLSVSQFVNRSLNQIDGDQDTQFKSTVTRAIQNSGINSNVSIDTDEIQPNFENNPEFGYNPELAAGNMMEDYPGYFSQVDFFSKLGSVLVARGDTFTIRAMGESLDPITGERRSVAYAEAVVQRTPAELTTGSNSRTFKIVALRWLPETEI